jgi:hypothetical protein
LVCAGIPFGIGAFSVFVILPFAQTSNTGVTDTSSQLSTIAYRVDVYQAEAAASGKRVSSFSLALSY